MVDGNFIILIDALRHDYVREDTTPFLFEQKHKGISAEVIESYSFQTRPAYFAGLEPDESDICHLFQYNPQASPFSKLKALNPLFESLEQMNLDRFIRGTLRRLAKRELNSRGEYAAADVISTEQIPLAFLPYFALSEREYTDRPGVYGDKETLFDLLRKNGKTWNWIGYPRHFGSTKSILAAYNKSAPADLSYLHFSELDWIGHRHGPDSKEISAALTEMDEMLCKLLSPALQAGRRVAIFGDHGMVQVQYSLDVWKVLHQLPIKAPKDYLFFLDSTQARFWFFSSHAETTVRSALAHFQGGHFLDDEERKELHIQFDQNWYGDEVFAIDGPGIIHPSFFSKTGSGPKGMHGYMPHEKDNMTQVFAFGDGVPTQQRGTIKLTDIFGILKEVLL